MPNKTNSRFEAVSGIEDGTRAPSSSADTAHVMESGRIVQTVPAAKSLDDPSIKEAYLGL